MSRLLLAPVLSLVIVAVVPLAESGGVPSPSSAPTAAPAATDGVAAVCNRTDLPRLCVRILSNQPGSKTASVRQLAEMSVHITARATAEAAVFIKSKLAAGGGKEPEPCIKGCASEIDRYAKVVLGLPEQIADDKFYELQEAIDGAAYAAESRDFEAQCTDSPSPDKTALWKKIERVRNLLMVTNGLMDAETESSYEAEEAGDSQS